MKLVLKDNDLFLKEQYGALHLKDAFIDFEEKGAKDTHVYKYEYAFNGETNFKPVKNGQIKIGDGVLDNPYVTIKVRKVKLSNGSSEEFKTDKLRLSRYVYFGESFEGMYPESIQVLKQKLETLDERIRKLEEEGDLL